MVLKPWLQIELWAADGAGLSANVIMELKDRALQQLSRADGNPADGIVHWEGWTMEIPTGLLFEFLK